MQEQVQIVTFDDDKAMIPERPPAEQPLPDYGTQQFADAINHSVISFLQRPQLIKKATWTSSMTRGSRLFEFDGAGKVAPIHVPDTMLTPMLVNKLDGFHHFELLQ